MYIGFSECRIYLLTHFNNCRLTILRKIICNVSSQNVILLFLFYLLVFHTEIHIYFNNNIYFSLVSFLYNFTAGFGIWDMAVQPVLYSWMDNGKSDCTFSMVAHRLCNGMKWPRALWMDWQWVMIRFVSYLDKVMTCFQLPSQDTDPPARPSIRKNSVMQSFFVSLLIKC